MYNATFSSMSWNVKIKSRQIHSTCIINVKYTHSYLVCIPRFKSMATQAAVKHGSNFTPYLRSRCNVKHENRTKDDFNLSVSQGVVLKIWCYFSVQSKSKEIKM